MAVTTIELKPGAMLGPYRLLERVGAGGMAEVWKGYQPSLDRLVAVKVLPREFAAQPDLAERFRREAIAISRLDHPNIMTVHDFGAQDGLAYMVTPFVGGGTLADLIGKPWKLETALRVLRPLASALDYAHARGVVHRDVKPSNVLISTDGRIVLSDFGLVRFDAEPRELTAVGAVVGTPHYMSPEQAAGQSAGAASDLYSLGVVAYALLTGRPPFSERTPLAVVLAHLTAPPPPARGLNPAIGLAVEAVLMRALAKQPAERYASAKALTTALIAAGRMDAGSTPTPVAPVRPAAAPTPTARRAPLEPPAGSSAKGKRPRRRALALVPAAALVVAIGLVSPASPWSPDLLAQVAALGLPGVTPAVTVDSAIHPSDARLTSGDGPQPAVGPVRSR